MISPAMRTLLLSALLFSTLAAAQNHNSGPTIFNEATIAQLQADMASGKVTSVELTQFYITRIFALDQNARDSNQVTPLISAAASGKLENLRLLINAGADVRARDRDGKSVLEYAARYPEVQEELRRAGAR